MVREKTPRTRAGSFFRRWADIGTISMVREKTLEISVKVNVINNPSRSQIMISSPDELVERNPMFVILSDGVTV